MPQLDPPYDSWIQYYQTDTVYLNTDDSTLSRVHPATLERGEDGAGAKRKRDVDVNNLCEGCDWISKPEVGRAVHETGYAILKALIPAELGERIKEDIRNIPASSWRQDFGPYAFEGSSKKNLKPTGRYSADYNKCGKYAQEAVKVVFQSLEKFTLFTDEHIVDGQTALMSKNAERQAEHIDFSYDTSFEKPLNPDGSLPYAASLLIALDDNTTFGLSNGTAVSIPKHAGILFRGDYPHCGDAFGDENTRYHMYITNGTASVPRADDANYVIPPTFSFFRYSDKCLTSEAI